MASNVSFQTDQRAWPPDGLVVESEQQIGGAQRQVVKVAESAAPASLPLPTGAATSANQTNGAQLSRIVDADGHQANVQAITDAMAGDEYGVITNAIIHGKTTAGGGAFIDVKVSPSGALQIGGTLDGIDSTVVTIRADDFYNDAFQRLRVSNTDQRFDSEFIYDKNPLLYDEILGGAGTATHNADRRDVVLEVNSTALASAAGLYQHWFNPYTPGNSQFIAITGALNGENLAGTAEVFLRSSVTGSVAEEVIPQAQWIAATSGVEWRYSQILLIDFQSLKVGRIRFALDRNGVAVPIASIRNDNEKEGGYWQMANAPTYWRVYNTADETITEMGYGNSANAVGFRFRCALNALQHCHAICATVKSEGGGDLLNMAGLPFAVSNGATTRTVTNAVLPILSLQLKTTFGAGNNRGLALPIELALLNDNPIYWEIQVNPTLTGASFNSVSANSICNFDIAASAISAAGRVIAAGFSGAAATGRQAVSSNIGGKIPLSVNYAGTVGDILTVAVIRVGTSNAATSAALDWKEVR